MIETIAKIIDPLAFGEGQDAATSQALEKAADVLAVIPKPGTDTILGSAVFRAINLMIDERAAELKADVEMLQDMLQTAFSPRFPMTVEVRTYEEDPERKAALALPIAFDALDRIAEIIADIRRNKSMIGDMQRTKLRLLNDYDFTKGDPSDQIAVFGCEPSVR